MQPHKLVGKIMLADKLLSQLRILVVGICDCLLTAGLCLYFLGFLLLPNLSFATTLCYVFVTFCFWFFFCTIVSIVAIWCYAQIIKTSCCRRMPGQKWNRVELSWVESTKATITKATITKTTFLYLSAGEQGEWEIKRAFITRDATVIAIKQLTHKQIHLHIFIP